MKILFIHSRYGFSGGEDSVVRAEIGLLRENGIEVRLLEFNNAVSPLRSLLGLPFNIASYKKVMKVCREYGPDLAHVHNTHFAASASVFYALKKSDVPVVNTLHNFRLLCPSATLFANGRIFTDSLKRSFPWKSIAKGVYRNSRLLTAWLAIGNLLHRKLKTHLIPARYILLTDFARDVFVSSTLAIPADRMRIKPNFVNREPLRPDRGTDFSGHFLFVGRLNEEKGIRVMLEAFAGTTHSLVIAGEGPLLPIVECYCREYENVQYVGQVESTEVSSLLSTATALIFPSAWYEGMPMTIIEALAAGCPVIASDLGAMRSMIDDRYNGLRFRSGDQHALRSAIDLWQRLDEEQHRTMRSNARSSYLNHYTGEENFRMLLGIYDEVIRQNSLTKINVAINRTTSPHHI